MKAIFMIHLSVVYLWERRGKFDGDVVFRFGLENLHCSDVFRFLREGIDDLWRAA